MLGSAVHHVPVLAAHVPASNDDSRRLVLYVAVRGIIMDRCRQRCIVFVDYLLVLVVDGAPGLGGVGVGGRSPRPSTTALAPVCGCGL